MLATACGDGDADANGGGIQDLFSRYDCENVTEDDICAYIICTLKDGYDALMEQCEANGADQEYCDTSIECYTEYVYCYEDNCDDETGPDGEALAECNDKYDACVGDR
jgi:hypothetical protein